MGRCAALRLAPHSLAVRLNSIMTGTEVISGSNHHPADVDFEYEEHSVIPVSATYKNGSPYSGTAWGSISHADWSGTYVNGAPHGQFKIIWGDKVTKYCAFNNGVKIKKT